MTLNHLDEKINATTMPLAALRPSRRLIVGDWSFRPVYSSYIDLLGVSHGRMPCLRV